MLTSLKFAIRRSLFYLYARIKYYYPMWLLFNTKARNLFKKNPPQLDETQQKILTKLQQNGIVVTSLEELFPGENMLQKLQAYEKNHRNNQQQYHKKKFFVDYWDAVPKFDLDDDYMELMVRPRILDIVNSYMQMFTQVVFYTLQMTDVTKGDERTFSQNWHRDPQEQKFCKVFVYLNDVDEDTGPFTYIPQSAHGQKYGRFFPSNPPSGSYPDTAELENTIPPEDIHLMTGKAGSVIFCDTMGLHRGGFAKKKPRIMSTFSYGAPTFRENTSYWYSQEMASRIKKLPPQAQFTLKKKYLKK